MPATAVTANSAELEQSAIFVASATRPQSGLAPIVLSINVRTIGASATRLAAWLEARGVRVWVCTSSLCGGADYREGIARAVKRCTVFIPLINEAWARSGERNDEFNLAKRLHLTSAEAGRSRRAARARARPIAFAGLDWDALSRALARRAARRIDQLHRFWIYD